jgi:hypothetical protein
VPRLSKAFAKQPFQPVSLYRRWYLLACYREPEPRAITLFISDQDGYTGVGVAGIVLEYLPEFECSRKSEAPRERFVGICTHVTG